MPYYVVLSIFWISLLVFQHDQSLLGNWQFEECSVKNTKVVGIITFKENGSFDLKAKAYDDCPTPSITGYYVYKTQSGQLSTNYDKGYGLGTYYLVYEDRLYFSDRPIKKPKETWANGYLSSNWTYRLIRK